MAKALYQWGGPGTIVVLNGDALFDFALAPALAPARLRLAHISTLACARRMLAVSTSSSSAYGGA